MPDPQVALGEIAGAAIEAAFGPRWSGTDPIVRPTANPEFGDFQINAAMSLAKALGRAPREVAEAIVAHLPPGPQAGVEVAGPGFINVTLADEWVAESVQAMAADSRLGVASSAHPQTVVVDYSAPNVAKEMHAGHLRSTVIGDSLARLLEFLGHRVVRQNHVGDWGTPFGMLIEHLLDLGEAEAAHELSVGDLSTFYQQARTKFDGDPGFAGRARQRVVALQSGDPETLRLWRLLVDESNRYFRAVYDRLGVLLDDDDIAGESFFNDELTSVVAELEGLGLAVVDAGALCVFPPGFTGRDGEPLPLIVRKSDGGYGYAATDLAALRHRVRDLGAERIAYVVGSPQAQHLAMVFAVATQAGWLGEKARAEHVGFGSVLGPDGKMLKSRAGTSVKLVELLDEAVERASSVVAAKNPQLGAEQRADVARVVGIGAVKFSDLSSDRVKDYVFDWDRMLSFDGNTAPYVQYAYVRLRSIIDRAGEVLSGPVVLEAPQERALALALLAFDGVVRVAADSFQPHRLANYLFEVAQVGTAFVENCPVLRAETAELRASRLVLCDVTSQVLRTGLGLLGIDTVERM